ncbi:hypothetical protein, partial [Aeromonas veronii]|uniref:hypothetical protein n=1 Tax=Aeromonas veronii TaxID=654 RepID=UPI003BA26D86
DGSESDVSSDPATTWRSSNSAVATVSTADVGTGVDTGGIASATKTTPTSAAQVSTQIISSTVIDGVEYKDAATLTLKTAALVKIEVSPGTYDLPRGLAFNGFKATGYFTDGSTKDITAEKGITWSSAHDKVLIARDESGVVTVSANSMPNADKGSPVDIKATSTATGIAGVAQLTVTDAVPVALRMDPITVTIGKTKDIGLKVVLSDGDEMLYKHGYSDLITEASSAAPDIAIVEDPYGWGMYSVRGKAEGNTTITVTMDVSTWPGHGAGSTISTTADVEVTNAVPLTLTITDLPLGGTMVLMSKHQLRALTELGDDVTDSVEWKVAVTPDATSAVDWDATDDTVATIDNGALSTKAKAGFVRVMAYAPTGSIGNTGALESSEASVQIEPWLPVPDVGEFMVPSNDLFNVATGRTMCTNMGGALPTIKQLKDLFVAYPNKETSTSSTWTFLGWPLIDDYWSTSEVPGTGSNDFYFLKPHDGGVYTSIWTGLGLATCIRNAS